MEKIREDYLEIPGGEIPIILSKEDDIFYITVDGVQWIKTENQMHAIVLYEMMADNITDYVNYQKI